MTTHYYIDGAGVTTDNRDSDETWLTYEDVPGITFRVSTKFCLDIVRNALENKTEDGIVPNDLNEALNRLEEAL